MPIKPKLLAESQSIYEESLHKLLSLADFERSNPKRKKSSFVGLGRMKELAGRLGNPQNRTTVVHVAGTKGKGSVASMVSSILQTEGLKVGLFTSPHLLSFRERIRINGTPLTETEFAEAVESVWPHILAMGTPGSDLCPSTFECLTAMAFHVFNNEQVDIQVLEVGLGGRLDSTNVAYGDVSVITSISRDHVNVLGETIKAIAQEKAGIIKPNSFVVSAPQEKDAYRVIQEVSRQQNAKLISLGEDVTWEKNHSDLSNQTFKVKTQNNNFLINLPLLGDHQQENASAAIAAVLALYPDFPNKSIEMGLSEWRWDGRFQILSQTPLVVIDGAHNEYSMKCLRETIASYFPSKKVKLIFGCSMDKELRAMAEQIAPISKAVIACASRHPKSAKQETISDVFNSMGLTSKIGGSVQNAIKMTLETVEADEFVLITGSLFVVGESLEFWHNIPPERYPVLERMGRI